MNRKKASKSLRMTARRGMDGREVGFTVRLFREGEAFVAHVPELDISSCGDTEEEARKNIVDAVAGFVNAAAAEGNLRAILEEAGYQLVGGRWKEPETIATEHMHLRVA
jgi:predicted RNase H-like HicB family nuclease